MFQENLVYKVLLFEIVANGERETSVAPGAIVLHSVGDTDFLLELNIKIIDAETGAEEPAQGCSVEVVIHIGRF